MKPVLTELMHCPGRCQMGSDIVSHEVVTLVTNAPARWTEIHSSVQTGMDASVHAVPCDETVEFVNATVPYAGAP